MVQTSAWLAAVETAGEALDLGRMAECAAALTAAEAAFAQIPVLAENYARAPWENWYRGSKKLNIAATLQRTRDVLQQADRASR
jgi:TorA maturation chaperone TorD